jgi:hypothetical protein
MLTTSGRARENGAYAEDDPKPRGVDIGMTTALGIARRERLAGTWIVTVNPPPPGQPFDSLQIYTHGGSVLEYPKGPPVPRTTAYGSWEHVKGRLYAATAVFYRVNQQGEPESEKINRSIRLAKDGQSFAVVSIVTRFDKDENIIGTPFKVPGLAKRMAVERIPDLPA